jgi:hypothetical protein
MTRNTSFHDTRRSFGTSTQTDEQNDVKRSESTALSMCDQEHESNIKTDTVRGRASDGTWNDGVLDDQESRLIVFEEDSVRPFSKTPRAMSLSELYATTSMSQTGTSDCK